jgi:SAM-dependent methyltransferase
MILAPRRATWRRWRRLANTRYSLLRSLEYEAIEGITLHGRTLDLGGGRGANYYPRLQIDGVLESLNLGVSLQPTVCADANVSWPFHAGVYDNVISLNTFEHLRNDGSALCEAIRVLRPGGQFHAIVPFLYRVHGSPSDYHRHTGYWWQETLAAYGLSSGSIVIEPLMWDPFSSAYALVEFNFKQLRGISKRLIMLMAVLRQSRWPPEIRVPESHAGGYQEFALGYYVRGEK